MFRNHAYQKHGGQPLPYIHPAFDPEDKAVVASICSAIEVRHARNTEAVNFVQMARLTTGLYTLGINVS